MLWGVSDLEVVSHAPMAKGATEVVSRWGWRDEEVGWTWAGAEAAPPLEVRVYTSHKHVELYLNGAKVGTADGDQIGGLTATFSVPYAAGNLTAVATTGADRRATRTLLTAGAPAAIRCAPTAPPSARRAMISRTSPPRSSTPTAASCRAPSCRSPSPSAVAKDGCRDAFAAALYRVGSGNPRDLGSFTSSERTTLRGKALAVFRPTATARAAPSPCTLTRPASRRRSCAWRWRRAGRRARR